MTETFQRDSYDAVVVGGGPAGATAAFHLASAGLRTAILEKEEPPRYKTCGGGVAHRAVERLPADISPAVEGVFRGADCNLLDAGLHFPARRAGPVLYMTMRADLDQLLLEAAAGAGAEVVPRCRVTGVEEERGAVELSTTAGALSAGFLVGADGVHGDVARLAGFPDGRLLAPALEYELRVSAGVLEAFQVPRFDFGSVPHGYAWVFPKRAHLSAGVVSMRRGPVNLHRCLLRYLEEVGVAGVESVERHGHLIPVRPRRGALARGRVLLAGDAAGLADPVTAEGITFAAWSGRLAAGAVISGEGNPARTAAEYETALHRTILMELRTARMAAPLLYGPPAVRRWLFRLYGQSLAEAMTDIFTGERTYRQLLKNPANYWKLFRVHGRRRGRRNESREGEERSS